MKQINIIAAKEIIYEHTLKNGLKVYIWPYKKNEEISLSLTVKYGSIHTKFKVNNKVITVPNGMAHFLEHIKFNESKDVTAHDYFYKMGSYTNAYTTYDHTSYEVICNNNLKDNLNHLLYFVLNPYFTKSLIKKEKGIIVEEAKMTMDNPYNEGYFALLKNIYHENNKKNLVTGTPEEIKKITIEDALNVFNNFYHPKNMFLTVTGNVNPFEVEKIVDEYFSDKQYPSYNKPVIIDKKEPDSVVLKEEVINTNVATEKLLLGFKIPKGKYKKYDDLHLRVLFNIILNMNFSSTSLFNDYLIKNDLIDSNYYMVSVEKNHIVIIFEVSTKYPEKVRDLITNKMSELEFSEEDFSRKNKSLIAGTILGYEDANDVNSDIRADIIRYGKIINNIAEVFKSLTVQQAVDIINKLNKYDISYVILKPKNN